MIGRHLSRTVAAVSARTVSSLRLAKSLSSSAPVASKTVKLVYVKPTGEKVTVDATIGDSLLEVAHAHKIDIEGACGGETACSTCHVIMSPEVFAKLPEPNEAEEDMLDLAAGLTKTSRLGCQVFATAELAGAEIVMPKEVNNMKA